MRLELAKFEHLQPLRSDANFFLCKVTGGPLGAKEIWTGLRKLGVFLRYFEKPAFMSDYIRVSVGRPRDTEALLRAIRIVMGSTITKTQIIASALPLKGIIFDMDGVLADESASYREAIVRTAGSYGVIVDSHYVASFKAKGASNNDWVCSQQILQEHGVTADLSEVTKRFEEFYQGNETTPGLWEVETLIPTKSLMRHLASTVPLAIVTGRPRRDAERFLAQHGIAEHFIHLVCMEVRQIHPFCF
jgi:HAD superfamily hydrolase (TIGR01548 family)